MQLLFIIIINSNKFKTCIVRRSFRRRRLLHGRLSATVSTQQEL